MSKELKQSAVLQLLCLLSRRRAFKLCTFLEITSRTGDAGLNTSTSHFRDVLPLFFLSAYLNEVTATVCRWRGSSYKRCIHVVWPLNLLKWHVKSTVNVKLAAVIKETTGQSVDLSFTFT